MKKNTKCPLSNKRRVHYIRESKYMEYEQRKAILQKKNLTADEYEVEIQKIIEELGI